jgi:hypothetical protein
MLFGLKLMIKPLVHTSNQVKPWDPVARYRR